MGVRYDRIPVLLLLFSSLIPAIWCGGDSFTEEFGPGWEDRWSHSSDTKYNGRFVVEAVEDPALKLPKESAHYGLTTVLKQPIDPSKGVVLQYEAKWASGHTCGGGYLKFFTYDAEFKPEDMRSDTPYTVMFGPDKCGSTNKVHLILRHKSPLDGEVEEKHLSNPPKVPSDPLTHVYTAILNPDNTVQVLIDGEESKSGSIFEIFDPPVNPPEEIPDPSDTKPSDWVDEEKIPDPAATKPDDWVDEPLMLDESAEKPDGWLDDEPEEIDDPAAKMPEEWDVEEDGDWLPPLIKNPKCVAAPGCGEWERPMIPNPDFKGEWSAPLIDNPDYKGVWVQKVMPNPKHFKDDAPFSNIGLIGAVGFEIWTMDKNMLFDNVVITQDADLAKEYRAKWAAKHALEEAEMAKEEEEKMKMKQKPGVGDYLESFIDNPALEPVQPYLQPVVEFAKDNETAFIGAAAAACVLFALSFAICCCRGRGRKSVDAGRAKKEDVTGPDDSAEPSNVKDDEEEEEEIEEIPTKDDDDDADDEEEEEDQQSKPRRRTRRAD